MSPILPRRHTTMTTQLQSFAALIAGLALVSACADDGSGTARDDAGAQQQDAAGGTDAGSADDAATSPDASADTADPGDDAGTPDAAAGDGPTFHGDVRALVEAHCTSCHRAGGIGPIPFDDPADWADGSPWWGQSAAQAVADERMPPWLPADDCRDIHGSRALSDDERGVFAAWAAAGYPLGDPADHVAPPGTDNPLDALGEPSLVIAPVEAYAADPRLPDDYRCLALDHTFDETTYLRAVDVYPGRDELVHHVLIYRVQPDDVGRLAELDAADPGPGYTCFGGSGAGSGGPVGAWVPGSTGLVMPDDAAIVVEAGTRLVMQVHYNTLSVDGEPQPDLTEVALWTYGPDEYPADEVSIIAFAHTRIDIPAGEPSWVEERTFNVPLSARVVGFAPHMHTLGTSFRASIVEPGGSEQCLIDIPAWDFDWQQFYTYEPDAFLDVSAGAQLAMECVFDNSPANQPVVNGERLEPRDVRWGEGTLDEMCLGYAITMFPYIGEEGCGQVPACTADCADGDTDCLWRCHTTGGASCAACHVEQAGACAQGRCGTELAAVLACLGSCDDDTVACLAGDCRDARDDVMTCLQPHIVAGTCDSQYASCAE